MKNLERLVSAIALVLVSQSLVGSVLAGGGIEAGLGARQVKCIRVSGGAVLGLLVTFPETSDAVGVYKIQFADGTQYEESAPFSVSNQSAGCFRTHEYRAELTPHIRFFDGALSILDSGGMPRTRCAGETSTSATFHYRDSSGSHAVEFACESSSEL